VDEVNDIMILDGLFNGFHFELIVQDHLEDSFGDVFIDNFEPARSWKSDDAGVGFFFVLFFVSFCVIGIRHKMRVFDCRVLDKLFKKIAIQERIFVKKLFINKKVLKAVRYITLSLTVINSKGGVDTDFIPFLFVGSIGHKLEDIFL
jgi:hypothetical protein